ncbi:serine hydrolase domain-containing protein [Flammeovirgaceae bacterium SG7u.111]|nr:serine hydrolase domain-containing protein [Flammeovirgaceae bacterium SG7u.132]WPO36818.1 serine hydrolase domain-containing protein [Flammeovirgaceae bacterium SG7u.111]
MTRTIILLLFFLTACSAKKQSSEIQFQTSLDSLIEEWHDQNQFDGTVLISHRGNIIYTKATGLANRVWKEPAAIDTKYHIASISKSMIACLVLQLVDEGKLRLDDPVMKFVPNFKDDLASKITLHHLLTHTSGMGHYEVIPDSLHQQNYRNFKRWNLPREEYIDRLVQYPLLSAPGEKFNYSSFAYYILMDIVEKTEIKPFAQVLKERITTPLGMENTLSPNSNEQVVEKFAEAYNWLQQPDSTFAYERNQFIDISLGITIYSTVGDLHKWGEALTKPTLLSEKSLALMKTNHLTEIGMNYGYGLAIHPENSEQPMGNLGIRSAYFLHGGALEGYRAMLTVVNDGEWIVTHLSNVGDRTNELKLSSTILKIITEPTYEK